jgi:predicted nucleic acid-binding protein
LTSGRIIALYDANVLYPAPLRDLLVRLARTPLVGARWSNAIHDEWMRNVLKNRPDLRPEQLNRTRELMEAAVPGASVSGFERHVSGLALPDPHDRHVLAAAIQARAGVIVTFNLRDFPEEALAPHRVEACHPDAFVLRLMSQHAELVCAVARLHRRALKHPPMSVDDYLSTLAKVGLVNTVVRLGEARDLL